VEYSKNNNAQFHLPPTPYLPTTNRCVLVLVPTYVRPTLHTIALHAASLTYLILSTDRNYTNVGIEHTTYDLHVQRPIRMANCSKLK